VITGRWRGSSWQVLDADPAHSGPIRDWITAAITGHRCPVDPADAALALTELFGNAVTHGPGGRVLVGYRLSRGGARLVVCDAGGAGAPRLCQGAGLAEGALAEGFLAEGGRGLQIVSSLATRWDTFRVAGARVVWCDLGQPLRTRAGDWAWLGPVLSACPLSAPRQWTPGQWAPGQWAPRRARAVARS
jgi:anti-sigma regulatory factor (Ser/Thr protein kinase)